MLDPIGGLARIREFFLSYLDTAFRIRSDEVSESRRKLLREPGTMTAETYLEPVPRYAQSAHPLEDLVDNPGTALPEHFDRNARRAFVEVALSGLFPGAPSGNDDVTRKSVFHPYRHQIEMLRKGTHRGTPGIVTSGTGSGKTESFMLPVLATIAAEAVKWPRPPQPLEHRPWYRDGEKFAAQRANESPRRPKAVRALLLYPMNALVEDQMTRLRRSLDSDEARDLMRERFNGNRIFFGRYTGATPVTGHLLHPRRAKDPDEMRRQKRRIATLRKRLTSIADMQHEARFHDRRNRERAEATKEKAGEETRFLFPSVDGSELVSRWDMHVTPPDIMVTNSSMLAAMLVREVDAPIFEATRKWLEEDEESYFFLVLDELHLIRGSAGMEVVGLLRSLFSKLGLDEPRNRHKLRILASSASLPVDESGAEESLKYLSDFFGSFGTELPSRATRQQLNETWRAAVVTGEAIPEHFALPVPLPAAPFVSIAQTLSVEDGTFVPSVKLRTQTLDDLLSGISSPLGVHWNAKMPAECVGELVAAASAALSFACTGPDDTAPRATSVGKAAQRLFGDDEGLALDALRGLCIVRGLGDVCGKPELYGTTLPSGLSTIRVHGFFRSIEGLFAAPFKDDVARLRFEGLTIERGRTHTHCDDGRLRRLFELVYCEACGDLFVGGLRNADDDVGSTELLTTSPNLEELPESASSSNFESLAHAQYAVFWPNTRDAEAGESAQEMWLPAVLDTRNGIVAPNGITGPYTLEGRLFRLQEAKAGLSPKAPSSAMPRCCPACGTDYFRRKKGMGAPSPIRSFRTGFAKSSQLLATELFGLLRAGGGFAKSVVFSDSRQDAARAALDIERRHHQDMRRQLLVEVLKYTAGKRPSPEQIAELELQLKAAVSSGDFDTVVALGKALQKAKSNGDPDRVSLAEVIEPALSTETHAVRDFLRRHVELGLHPIDPAGVESVRKRQWYEWLELGKEGEAPRWLSDMGDAGEARQEIKSEQRPLTYEVLFSKTYFALEETGVGYPSLTAKQADDSDRLDAYLRVFADAYRVVGNRWSDEQPHLDDPSQLGARNRILKFARAKAGDNALVELRELLERFRALGHEHGLVELSGLYIRFRAKGDPYFRCVKCGRVHLHRGVGLCTRCHAPLPSEATGKVEELWDRNFLGRRITRSSTESSAFRLRCEELTGQTGSPADRLRRFKGIFVGDDGGPRSSMARRASEVDLLSVTTTMEVGIDIGALQAVYQANMPPQRFNYQQRVGRAGRRGQAFSLVITLCRSRSHDLYYFRNPARMTGDAPPPPFLTTEHPDILNRVVHKSWLSAAFALLRDEDGESYAGDEITDTHGDFPLAREVFSDGKNWRTRLKRALQMSVTTRDSVIRSLVDGSVERIAELQSGLKVDALLDEIWALRVEGEGADLPFGQYLAEHGLLPMYGMPTRVRPLYLGVDFGDDGEPEFSSVDRDLDIAIYEFAPGRSLVRDKRRHEAIGFSPSLREPVGNSRKAMGFGNWWGERRFVGRCVNCGAVTTQKDQPFDLVECKDCGEAVPKEAFSQYVSPQAFTTRFLPLPVDESESIPQFRREVNLEAGTIILVDVPSTNLAVALTSEARVLRLNDGTVADDGSIVQKFDVVPVKEHAVPAVAGARWTLPKQGIDRNFFDDRFMKRNDDLVDEQVGLMARKKTDALFLTLQNVPPGLDIAKCSRAAADTSVRAALISATQLLVQRAALALDVAPEEFEALEPRVRHGRPVLQIADFLVNGAGFSSRLANGSLPPIAQFARSMTVQCESDELVAPFLAEQHRADCSQACYTCLQRYGNRSYHGLLDWRLGLSMLRVLVDERWRVGLDGDWSAAAEVRDWPTKTLESAEAIAGLSPDKREVELTGRLSLPTIRLKNESKRFVLVHPFWSLESVRSLVADGFKGETFAVDSFQATRRPQKALRLGVAV